MSLYLHATLVFLGAILATIYLVPKVISIVKFKQLMDDPNERSSHAVATPSLGGIAFFIVFILSLYFNDQFDTFNISMSIIPGLTILFFLGLKDDIMVLAPRTKLIGQVLACGFVLFHYKFEVETFHGFFGIYGLNPIVGSVIGLFVMLAIINALNLIDGIDGLASSIGIICFSSFTVLFFILDRNFLALSALTMVGILTGFLMFNLSQREKRKIFMGDTGSMLIGFLLAVMSIRLLALEAKSLSRLPFDRSYIPMVIFVILLIPLYDTTRVFILRILQGRSPFSPDRNHLHLVLLDAYGLTHRRTTFILAASAGFTVIAIFVLIRTTNLWISGIVLLLLCILVSFYLYRLQKKIALHGRKMKHRVNKLEENN